MIEIMNSDYILFARARGESDRQLVLRHGLRNVALPAVTLQFASFSELFGGIALAETVFFLSGTWQCDNCGGTQCRCTSSDRYRHVQRMCLFLSVIL